MRSINTYGGHPVACAVELRNIEIAEREGLVARAAEMGVFLKKILTSYVSTTLSANARSSTPLL